MKNSVEINIGLDREAAMLARLRQLLISKGIYANIQPFEIRVEKAISSGDVSFTYELARRANMTPRENYLVDNDAFVMLSMAIGIFKEDNSQTGNFSRGGNTFPLYYPDVNFFNTAGTGVNVSEAAALESIYNGFVTAKSDVTEVLFRLNTERFRKAPRTQYTVGAAGFPATLPNYEGEQYQDVPMPALFEGKNDNQFSLKIAQKSDTVLINGDDQSEFQNYIVIQHRGLVIRQYSEPTTIQEIRNSGLVVG